MIAVSSYRADNTRVSPVIFPLVNRSVCRSPAAEGYTFYNTIASPFYPPYTRFPMSPFRKPVYFLCKVRLPVARPVKDRLRLLPENLPPQLVGERIFRILLAWAGRQSRGQKNKQPSGTGRIEGKNKKTIHLKI